MKILFLVTGKNCPLCDEARKLLSTFEFGDIQIQELDVQSDDKLHIDYWDKIPVILYRDKSLSWPFNEETIRDFILN